MLNSEQEQHMDATSTRGVPITGIAEHSVGSLEETQPESLKAQAEDDVELECKKAAEEQWDCDLVAHYEEAGMREWDDRVAELESRWQMMQEMAPYE